MAESRRRRATRPGKKRETRVTTIGGTPPSRRCGLCGIVVVASYGS